MLTDVKRIIEEGHLGVRTFEQFAIACLQRAAQGDADTVALFVFAKVVQPFAEYYFDQALTEMRAVAFRDQLVQALEAYNRAAGPEDKQAVLRELIQKGLQEQED